jgi:hypothetical protein
MLALRQEDFEALKDMKLTVVSSALRAVVSVVWSPWWKSNGRYFFNSTRIYLYSILRRYSKTRVSTCKNERLDVGGEWRKKSV